MTLVVVVVDGFAGCRERDSRQRWNGASRIRSRKPALRRRRKEKAGKRRWRKRKTTDNTRLKKMKKKTMEEEERRRKHRDHRRRKMMKMMKKKKMEMEKTMDTGPGGDSKRSPAHSTRPAVNKKTKHFIINKKYPLNIH
jgi:hypothetical protein